MNAADADPQSDSPAVSGPGRRLQRRPGPDRDATLMEDCLMAETNVSTMALSGHDNSDEYKLSSQE
jgi:hypothetical protein